MSFADKYKKKTNLTLKWNKNKPPRPDYEKNNITGEHRKALEPNDVSSDLRPFSRLRFTCSFMVFVAVSDVETHPIYEYITSIFEHRCTCHLVFYSSFSLGFLDFSYENSWKLLLLILFFFFTKNRTFLPPGVQITARFLRVAPIRIWQCARIRVVTEYDGIGP